MIKNIFHCDCDPQTFYECGGLGKNRCEYAVVKDTINVALCESRHEIPEAVNGAIFPEVIDNPMDFGALRIMAENALNPLFTLGVKNVNVYVTGLTPALLTVVNLCRERGIKCITFHYNKTNGQYFPLPMV